jgi:hypothetical protein
MRWQRERPQPCGDGRSPPWQFRPEPSLPDRVAEIGGIRILEQLVHTLHEEMRAAAAFHTDAELCSHNEAAMRLRNPRRLRAILTADPQLAGPVRCPFIRGTTQLVPWRALHAWVRGELRYRPKE